MAGDAKCPRYLINMYSMIDNNIKLYNMYEKLSASQMAIVRLDYSSFDISSTKKKESLEHDFIELFKNKLAKYFDIQRGQAFNTIWYSVVDDSDNADIIKTLYERYTRLSSTIVLCINVVQFNDLMPKN